MNNKVVIYEKNCFNCLMLKNLDLLEKIFDKIIIPQFAYTNMKNKYTQESLQYIESYINKEFILIEDFDTSTEEYAIYNNMIKGKYGVYIGKQESFAITLAIFKNYKLLYNKNNIIKEIDKHELTYVSIIESINNAYVNNKINIDEAKYLCNELNNMGLGLENINFN